MGESRDKTTDAAIERIRASDNFVVIAQGSAWDSLQVIVFTAASPLRGGLLNLKNMVETALGQIHREVAAIPDLLMVERAEGKEEAARIAKGLAQTELDRAERFVLLTTGPQDGPGGPPVLKTVSWTGEADEGRSAEAAVAFVRVFLDRMEKVRGGEEIEGKFRSVSISADAPSEVETKERVVAEDGARTLVRTFRQFVVVGRKHGFAGEDVEVMAWADGITGEGADSVAEALLSRALSAVRAGKG